MKITMKTPDEIFAKHFTNNAGRDNRSAEYKWGVVDALNLKAKGVKLAVPFAEGTVERGAYFAGYEEGKLLYQLEKDKDKALGG